MAYRLLGDRLQLLEATPRLVRVRIRVRVRVRARVRVRVRVRVRFRNGAAVHRRRRAGRVRTARRSQGRG